MGNTQQKPAQAPQPPRQEQESLDSSTFTCEICIEPVSLPTRKFNNNRNCVHPFCTDCMIKYIQVKLEDNAAQIKCPALDCDQFLDPLSCRPLIERQLFDKWCDVLCDSTVLAMDGVYCPNRNCSALVVNECGGNVKRSVCPSCKKKFCFRCRVPWHAGFRCEESGEMRDLSDVAFGVLAEARKWMRCPRCRHFVELAQGCAIVHCRCGTNFCYKCGKHVNHHWCNCHRTSMCCMVLCQLCIVIVVIYPFILLFMAVIMNH